MARGDTFYFDQYYEDVGNKLHDNSADVFKLGIVTNAFVPVKTTPDPRWGANGTTDFSLNEVTPGGNYPGNGISLSAVITDNWIRTGSVNTQTFDDVAIAVDPGNPSGAYWGIIYNDTDAGKRCVGVVDLGGPLDLTTGTFSITWDVQGFGNLAG